MELMNGATWKKYVKSKREMLNKYSVEEFRKWMAEWKKYIPDMPEDEKLMELTLNKMIANSTDVTPKLQKKAKKWLLDRGYSQGL